MWVCRRVSPPRHRDNPALSPLIATETSDTEITTTEIIKRRDVGFHGIRSEYCIRKIICPLGLPETPKGKRHHFSWQKRNTRTIYWLMWGNFKYFNKSVVLLLVHFATFKNLTQTRSDIVPLPFQKPTPPRGRGYAPVPCAPRSLSRQSRRAQWWLRPGWLRRSSTSGRSEPSQKGQRGQGSGMPRPHLEAHPTGEADIIEDGDRLPVRSSARSCNVNSQVEAVSTVCDCWCRWAGGTLCSSACHRCVNGCSVKDLWVLVGLQKRSASTRPFTI